MPLEHCERRRRSDGQMSATRAVRTLIAILAGPGETREREWASAVIGVSAGLYEIWTRAAAPLELKRFALQWRQTP